MYLSLLCVRLFCMYVCPSVMFVFFYVYPLCFYDSPCICLLCEYVHSVYIPLYIYVLSYSPLPSVSLSFCVSHPCISFIVCMSHHVYNPLYVYSINYTMYTFHCVYTLLCILHSVYPPSNTPPFVHSSMCILHHMYIPLCVHSTICTIYHIYMPPYILPLFVHSTSYTLHPVYPFSHTRGS